MSNFNFLKSFNNELYKIGERLEEDVKISPRAVTADATTFLEMLVDDIYVKSGLKINNIKLPFYKKIDKLYRAGEITYIYKNKLHDAYNLRSEIHNDYKNIDEEFYIALDLHQKLFYISKKYYRDYCETYNKYDVIPRYRPPIINKIQKKHTKEVHFERCIICGNMNGEDSNFCEECNRKIENANYYMTIRNTFGKDNTFTKRDLIDNGISESYALSLIMQLTSQNLIEKKGQYFNFNNVCFDEYLNEVNTYIDISLLLSQFYNDEISPDEIKKTDEYENFPQFRKIVDNHLIEIFEKSISNLDDIKSSIENASINYDDVMEWFTNEKNAFICGDLNDAFINFNEILIEEYKSEIRMNCFDEEKIQEKLHITGEIYDFWCDYYLDDDIDDLIVERKKYLIISELKRNKTLKEALKYVELSKDEFGKIYDKSKAIEDQFYLDFQIEYVKKRQNLLIRYLKSYDVSKALIKAKLSKKDFCEWYFNGEYREFHMKAKKILMNKYFKSKKEGIMDDDILKTYKIPKVIFDSWIDDDNYIEQINKINIELSKRNLLIKALKENKNFYEMLEYAHITKDEFDKLYADSRKIKSDFYRVFDYEYDENRKRVFVKYLKNNDFLNSIVKSDISIKKFNKWYAFDERQYLSKHNLTDFYRKSTELLMDQYIEARLDGKSKAEASKSIGLSKSTVDYWMRHSDVELFGDFNRRIHEMEVQLVCDAIDNFKSKIEISDLYDISKARISEIIESNDNIKESYLKKVICNQLKVFLREIKNKTYKKALKKAYLTESQVERYYILGKDGCERYSKFHEKYMEFKINTFTKDILLKKSEKIAFKNSRLTREEYLENSDVIEDKIIDGKLNIMVDELFKSNPKGSTLAYAANMSLEEVYEWYFKGKEGDEKFEFFALSFDLFIIYIRKTMIQKALNMGFQKNKVMIRLKKDLGRKEFEIWKEYGIIDSKNVNYIELGDDKPNVSYDKLREILSRSKEINWIMGNTDDESFQYMKHAIQSIL